jgi:hypothetical protein
LNLAGRVAEDARRFVLASRLAADGLDAGNFAATGEHERRTKNSVTQAEHDLRPPVIVGANRRVAQCALLASSHV